MKILFLLNIGFESHTTSEHLLSAVIEQLANAGHYVHVIQMVSSESKLVLPEILRDYGVTTDGVLNRAPKKSSFISRYLNAIHYYWKCRSLLKVQKDVDAVFLQSTNVAGIVVWLTRKYLKNAKVIYNVQDIFPYNALFSGIIKKNSIVFKILAFIQRYGYKHSDKIITISEDMKDTLVADGINGNKIEVIYNWSYQDRAYENLDLTLVDNIFNKEYFNVVYAGNIGVMQNVDVLIESANIIKNEKSVWFHIIGNGVNKEKLELRAKEYGITNISFWEMQPPDLAPYIYSAADVNVIPLVKGVYRTAMPSKTATCLACQKPIILAIGKESRYGQKLVKEADCQLVEADDPEELVNAIKKIQKKQFCKMMMMGSFYNTYCSKTLNSRKYTDIITGDSKYWLV